MWAELQRKLDASSRIFIFRMPWSIEAFHQYLCRVMPTSDGPLRSQYSIAFIARPRVKIEVRVALKTVASVKASNTTNSSGAQTGD